MLRPALLLKVAAGVASRSISDWRKSAVMPPMEMDSEPPRPRSINGHFLPARVHVDLRDAPATQQQARIRDDHLSVRHRNTSRSRTRRACTKVAQAACSFFALHRAAGVILSGI
ncbi:hypothetical protein B0H14DRAFT_3441862 [Mycena olivaceomarginata]|nr:hypothetical protein B0H14DRAFT_3441862 [Mycena olivaceomarginata]